MSAYIQFFTKVDNKYIPINSYCRSNIMYEILSGIVSYEKMVHFTDDMCNKVLEELNDRKQDLSKCLEECDKKVDVFIEMKHPNMDTVRAISEIMDEIDYQKRQIETDLEMIEHYKNFILTFSDMKLEISLLDDEDLKKLNISEEDYLFVGHEVPAIPTDEDLVCD